MAELDFIDELIWSTVEFLRDASGMPWIYIQPITENLSARVWAAFSGAETELDYYMGWPAQNPFSISPTPYTIDTIPRPWCGRCYRYHWEGWCWKW